MLLKPASIFLQGGANQNRAFPGDEVAVLVFPTEHWLPQKSSAMGAAKQALAGPDDSNLQSSFEVVILQDLNLKPRGNVKPQYSILWAKKSCRTEPSYTFLQSRTAFGSNARHNVALQSPWDNLHHMHVNFVTL